MLGQIHGFCCLLSYSVEAPLALHPAVIPLTLVALHSHMILFPCTLHLLLVRVALAHRQDRSVVLLYWTPLSLLP